MRRILTMADEDRGFTIVELMVAITILLVGLLGTVAIIDHATSVAGTNNGRVAATNLAREILEDARSVDYERLNPSQIAAALQGRPGLGGSGNPWTLTRRGVDYSASVTVCTVDQPKDGLAAAPPQNACPRATAIAGAPLESNPDDFRNVTVVLTWNDRGQTRTLTQSSLIVNPAGGLGPRIIEFPEPIHLTSGTEVRWDGTVETSGANAVRWAADDSDGQGEAQGDATGGNVNWTIVWDIGTYGTGDFVYDGTYTVTAQAFDAHGVAGESRLAAVLLNRRAPFAPTDLSGGRNGRFGGNGIVDLRWNASPERDVLGYRVYRQQGTGAPERVCPGGAQEVLKVTTCTDPDAPAGEVTYLVYAVDREDLASTDSPLREGDAATIIVSSAGQAPPSPTEPSIVDTDPVSGSPRLQWTQPVADPPILFYRIYRDTGTDLDDRYAVTATAEPTWTDPEPGTATSHSYWVTAVDENFNESDPLGPLLWTAQ
jgi:prepilin-type N-terminal cleavage/methylation domain-containing protein